ncbi:MULTISPECIES: sugar phosphate isomerase/epimerase and 4-hydroxyphenylpyruvate domain-containing protein [unclassified Chelatococcus]|uniref:bifunctional sugar phosphate isomerase/epimerase/4-hydroxyphenylpyruvate dioxygenase family protein n=1 Tax=unclassified Chelatococcus TaxID=2638111 RepID=UPI001BCDAC10|nr:MULTISPECIES: sugar phosphate isomerase/epimerase and 4-hydroxyphenylpyruvate domain-containing protein [unclassified Chelatococcus]MBS7699813.1 sugar phosphate isomerase/epimerase and 4-hydroxyphenylpyruvate domain-containing protein [Chelatococcus sp. YT9]MBX3558159.1 sugar phosphate isomerase/epimerase and 4-hydroxyphenylpyruvate domain-containing protein [Chelatococcus sp.]
MIPSIATVCVSGTLQEKLEAIAAAGFRAVEIFENDLIAFPGSPAEVRRICADLGLAIVTCQPFRDFEGMPEARRARTFDRAERKFDLLQELGTDLLFVCSNVSPESLGGIDRLAQDFAELGERASRRSMRIGFEALAWGRHVWDYRDAWEIVRRANRDNIGVVLDSFHILSRGLDLTAMTIIPRDKIAMVQMADAPRLQMDHLSWSRHWRCLPGQGDLDLPGFMNALVATGYDGILSLEIFNDRFRAGSARSVALDGHRSLIWLLDDTSRKLGHAVPGAVPMPPPTPVEAVEFIEFAVAEALRPTFEGLLAALGFLRAGAHRSKDVGLWRQGDIRVVLNSDVEGFAHSYQITHGTSVCAIALRVADAQATIRRATALLDTPHTGAVGPGELDIPAVRGLGGSLLYFLDNASALGRWAEVDFAPTGETGADVGLIAVDHISQSMQYEEMLTWVLFYSSLFETTKAPSQAVIDPGGVVQSQVIESGLGDGAGRGLRLILNGSQSHRTLSARFITDFFGSGVQHIAFATANIQATVKALVANGVAMLPIPENYYDDLEARFDLPADELSWLKTLNILYDRDETGVFYQAYTTTLDGGLFFEIVQRDRYSGYGAANAGIRLTAQARLARPATIPAPTRP